MSLDLMPPPKGPSGLDWTPVPALPGMAGWASGPLLVMSSVASMQLPGAPEGVAGPTWLVSVSSRGRRAKVKEIRRALRAFDMREAEEDNHEPGIARKFFMPVDPAFRSVCECKLSERVVTEPDGYQWTTPKDGPCRGCAWAARFGKLCPLHPDARRMP